MTNIYRFPPVGLVACRVQDEQPALTSRYAFTGKRTVSAYGPRRRLVDITAQALAKDHRAGAGYLAQLMRYIDGGVHLVRMVVPPENWYLDRAALAASVGNQRVNWTSGSNATLWTDDGDPVFWLLNAVRMAAPVTLSGYPAAIEVSGLPPGQIVARPGDVVRVLSADTGDSLGAATVLDLTRANSVGVAVVPVSAELPAGIAAFGDEVDAAFEVTNYAPAEQGVGSGWTVQMSLREVLASEIDAPIEVNPWR